MITTLAGLSSFLFLITLIINVFFSTQMKLRVRYKVRYTATPDDMEAKPSTSPPYPR